jgi:hypothetical protein
MPYLVLQISLSCCLNVNSGFVDYQNRGLGLCLAPNHKTSDLDRDASIGLGMPVRQPIS